MKSGQELIHWLEMGGGVRWVRLAAALAATLALSLLIVWKQFHGPASESTLLQADVARQIAGGHGCTTLVNYGETAAVRLRAGQAFDPRRPYPELHHAPLYSFVLAAGLKLLPAGRRAALFAAPAQLSDGFGGDYFLLAVNLALFWLTAWLTFLLGRKLFDARTGWVAALAVLVSLPFWQQTLAVNGTALLMVLALLTFLVWSALERHRGENGAFVAAGAVRGRRFLAWLLPLALGLVCGLLFLTEYSAGAMVLVALGAAIGARPRRAAWRPALAIALGFAAVAGPWVVRNVALTGSPVALAAENVALKAGDSTAEPAARRASLSAEPPRVDLRKLGNKTLTSLQETVKTRIWAGGGMWVVAFFIAGWLYPFRAAVTNRMRWLFSVALAVLLLAQAALNSGASERLPVIWLAPVMIVFGVGFFFVLLASNPVLGRWPRLVATGLLALQALPLVHDALAPAPAIRFHYPPYFPALIRGLRTELEVRRVGDRFGVMSDVPAGVAWYAGVRCWAQPPKLRDFYAITLQQPIGELLLTPRTLDRPFFSELNGHGVAPGSLGTIANRFGEWGEIYGGLVTGTMPREFPLNVPHKIAENLYVLLNPALPPPRGL